MTDENSGRTIYETTIDINSWADDSLVLSAYVAQPRRLLDWRENPLVPPNEGAFDYPSLKAAYDDYTYLDGICERLCSLPTIKAAIKTVPNIRQTDLYQGYIEEFSWGGLYSSDNDEVELNARAKIPKGCTVDHMMIAHAAHELGHSRQKHLGCFDYEESADHKNSISAQIALSRSLEADATCFSIVVGYEYSIAYGDDGILRGLCGFSRSASVIAYLEQIAKDPTSHEDGRAAQAAYDAYFSKSNARLLKTYDLKVCESFSLEAENSSRRGRVISPLSLTTHFWDSMKPINFMPYMNQNGDVVRRVGYAPTSQTSSLFKRVSRAARQAARFEGITIEI